MGAADKTISHAEVVIGAKDKQLEARKGELKERDASDKVMEESLELIVETVELFRTKNGAQGLEITV